MCYMNVICLLSTLNHHVWEVYCRSLCTQPFNAKTKCYCPEHWTLKRYSGEHKSCKSEIHKVSSVVSTSGNSLLTQFNSSD